MNDGPFGKSRLKRLFRLPVFLSAITGFAALSLTPAGLAHPWHSNPQPLVEAYRAPDGTYAEGPTAITSDAGSALAWDPGLRTLWSFAYGSVQRAYWTSYGFWWDYPALPVVSNSAAGLLVDPSVHFLYCVDLSGIPWCIKTSGTYPATQLDADAVQRLLAVDTRTHSLFAYDASARGIRRYVYHPPAKGGWTSSLIATGLGDAGGAGVFDYVNSVLYTTHKEADTSIPRSPLAQTIGDPTGVGLFSPWPLVATALTGSNVWSSSVLDETGVPQQPAIRRLDNRVFYARRDDFDSVHYYQPARRHTVTGSINGCSGLDTYVDDERYPIVAPDYPSSWGYDGYGSVTTVEPIFGPWAALPGPITFVPYYVPLLTKTAIPDRLASFGAAIDPARGRLVQNRVRYRGELLVQQSGWQLGGYLYRGSNGLMATEDLFGTYPALGPDFNPSNPPSSFAALSGANTVFYYDTDFETAPAAPYSMDANAPVIPPYLSAPTRVDVRTFGYKYGLASAKPQPGGRYQTYTGNQVTVAVPCSLAIDALTGVTFYTQAQDPNASSGSEQVWTVMVY